MTDNNIQKKLKKALKTRDCPKAHKAKGNTVITVDNDGIIHVTLRGNEIATIAEENVTFNNCGWNTGITAARINLIMECLGLDARAKYGSTWTYTVGKKVLKQAEVVIPLPQKKKRKREKKKAKKSKRVKTSPKPVWFTPAIKKQMQKYFRELKEHVKKGAHKDDDVGALMDEEFCEEIQEGDVTFVNNMGNALVDYAVSKKRYTDDDFIDEEIGNAIDYLCDTLPGCFEGTIADYLEKAMKEGF